MKIIVKKTIKKDERYFITEFMLGMTYSKIAEIARQMTFEKLNRELIICKN